MPGGIFQLKIPPIFPGFLKTRDPKRVAAQRYVTSPPLPLLLVEDCRPLQQRSHTRREVYEDFTVREVVFLDSRLAAISILSEMLTYKSIGLDASMAERQLIWHLPIELTGWEYWVSHNLLPL